MQSKRISFFWAQGEATAPDLVKRCWEGWENLNPGWSVEVSQDADAEQAFSDLGLIHVPQTFQGRADIFRVWDIAKNGGVYVDCATIAMRPLDDWLGPLMESGFFAFHDPYRKRPIENWFLASEPGHPLAQGWLTAMQTYWDQPRQLQRHKRALDRGWKGELACQMQRWARESRKKQVLEPKNRRWSVLPEGGAARPLHPYFWPHYLFDAELHRNLGFREAWAKVPKRPSYENLMLRHWKRDYQGMSDTELDSLLDAPMQKLSLKTLPDAAQLDRIFARAAS